MKRMILVLLLTIFVLAACVVPPAETMPAPVESTSPALPASTETVPAPTESRPDPKLPAASFESQPYINEAAGFALDIPLGWTVKEVAVGPRGTQLQFLSAPELADMATLPEGAARVNATIYQWDPRNDLAAFVANQKTAWDASGFAILEEEEMVLELGLPAVQLVVQTPEANVVFLIAALGDQYLVLSGEGNLELVKEIVGRVRPIS